MRTVTHPAHQKDFDAGYAAKVAEIEEMGIKAARAKFCAEIPADWKPASLGAYYYADGELRAIIDNR